MKIDICIPAHNEAPIIAESIRAVRAAFAEEPRIIVADNASTDGTGAAARAAGAEVLMVATKGKGAAVIAAARMSTADVFGFIDADLSADPADMPAMVALLEQGRDVVIGSRLLNATRVRRGMLRTFSSVLFNGLRRRLLGIAVEDTQCGLKFMNGKGREVLAQCEETGWFFDMEFLVRAENVKLKIFETPVHWEEWRFQNRVSKLRVLSDGIEGLRAMIRIRKRLSSNI